MVTCWLESHTNPIWLLVRVICHGSGQPIGSTQTVILLPISNYVCRAQAKLVHNTFSRRQHRLHNIYNDQQLTWQQLTQMSQWTTITLLNNNMIQLSWHWMTQMTWNDLQRPWHRITRTISSVKLDHGAGWTKEQDGPQSRMDQGAGWTEEQDGLTSRMDHGAECTKEQDGLRSRMDQGAGWTKEQDGPRIRMDQRAGVGCFSRNMI